MSDRNLRLREGRHAIVQGACKPQDGQCDRGARSLPEPEIKTEQRPDVQGLENQVMPLLCRLMRGQRKWLTRRIETHRRQCRDGQTKPSIRIGRRRCAAATMAPAIAGNFETADRTQDALGRNRRPRETMASQAELIMCALCARPAASTPVPLPAICSAPTPSRAAAIAAEAVVLPMPISPRIRRSGSVAAARATARVPKSKAKAISSDRSASSLLNPAARRRAAGPSAGKRRFSRRKSLSPLTAAGARSHALPQQSPIF